jgi:drug/metabolite transporter (DMT)-like permease
VAFAIGFGVLAAFLFAAAASLQQRAAHRHPPPPAAENDGPPRRTAVFVALWRLIQRLVREPLWLIGWTTNLVGFGAQALALRFGSVALVQPLLVTQLLFALPMAAAWQRRRPTARDWVSSALICGGLVVFFAVRGVAPLDDEANRLHLLLGCLAAAAAVLLILLFSAGMPPFVRATMIAIGAGVCFAVSAAMIKLTTDDLLVRGVAATARDWPGYALAASTLSGLLLGQGAFAAGSLPSAVAAMSITNPVVSYLLGVYAFGVEPPRTPAALAGLAGAGALISLGAIGLAHSSLVRSEEPALP